MRILSPEIEQARSQFRWDKYCRKVRFHPHPGQIPPLDAFQDPEVEILVLVYGRRAGKTKLCGNLAAGSVVQPDDGGVVWTVAPTYQLARMVYREAEFTLRRNFKSMVVEDRTNDMVMKCRWHPDEAAVQMNELDGKSADSEVSLLGAGLRLAILDEAARMKPEIWNEYVSPALEERNGKAVIVTTPRGRGHWTYSMWRAGRNDTNTGPAKEGPIRSYRYPSWINPLIDRNRIEQRLKDGRMTERSYRENYCAEFLEDGGMVFRDVRSRALLDTPRGYVENGMSYTVGADLARYSDYTVFVVMNRRKEVVHFDRLPHIEWSIQETKLIELARRYNRARIVIDASGVGDPIAETLTRKGHVPVVPFKYTGQSKGELIDHLIILFERGDITLPKYESCPWLIDELEAYEYVLTRSRRLRMEAPSGQNDDCVNALALAAWGWKATDAKEVHIVTKPVEALRNPYGRDPDRPVKTMKIGGVEFPWIR